MTLATYVTYPWAYGGSGGGGGGGGGGESGGDGLIDFIGLIFQALLFVVVGPLYLVGAAIYYGAIGLFWLLKAFVQGSVNVASAIRGRVFATASRLSQAAASRSATSKSVDNVAPDGHADLPSSRGDYLHEYLDVLDSNEGEIRLLIVEPAITVNAEIVCRLRTVKLGSSDCPDYAAISYYWGKSSDKSLIELDGREEEFPVNAIRCIRNIRGPLRERCIWIDSICVNQHDKQERSHQVAIMHRIYQHASSVLVCLGMEGSFVGDYLTITTAVAHLIEQWRQETKSGRDVRKVMFSSNNTPLTSRTEIPHGALPASLQRLFQDPWLTRLWVVQEASLAPQGKVLMGCREFDLTDILRTAAWLQHKMPNGSTGVRNAAMIWRYADREFGLYASSDEIGWIARPRWGTLVRLVQPGRVKSGGRVQATRSSTNLSNGASITDKEQHIDGDDRGQNDAMHDQSTEGRSKFQLTSLLRDFHAFDSSDRHDRIYALLGLSMQPFSTEPIWRSLQPDYRGKSPTQVYRDATRAAIYEIASLDILAITLPFHSPGRGPTWAPNWDSVDTQDEQPKSLPLFFRASTPDKFAVADLYADNVDVLIATGIDFASVKSASPSLNSRNFDTIQSAAEFMSTEVRAISDEAKRMAPPIGNDDEPSTWAEDLHQSIGLALVAGATYTGADARRQPTYARDWKAFHQICDGVASWQSRVEGPVQRFVDAYDADTRSCALRYLESMRRACVNRRLFLTDDGHVGVGPRRMKQGDRICILNGGNWPFLLRRVDDRWNFVGAAYVHGVMLGEVKRQNRHRQERFEIW